MAEVVGEALLGRDDETPLSEMEDIRYDSSIVLECVGAIEQEFGIDIDLVSDDLSHSFRSVSTIRSLMERKVADAQALEDAAVEG